MPAASKRKAVVERRRVKRAAAAARLAQDEERDRARVLRELAQRHLLVNADLLAVSTSYGTPDFVTRGYYVDLPFRCRTCGIEQVWTEAQQKWWYESAKGDVWSTAVQCKPCRRRERERKAAARAAQAAATGRAAAPE